MHNEIITAARPNKKRSFPQTGTPASRVPLLERCEGVTRTFEASRQKAVASGSTGSVVGGLAEIGWLNSCEHHGFVTFNRLSVCL